MGHPHHHQPDDRGEGRQRRQDQRFRFQPGPGGPGGWGDGPPVGRHGGPGFGPGFGGRGRRGRPRGDVRAAILLLLDEQPRHGYELIQEIAERSQGSWTPSPGSIYPTLQAMEDEGLITIETVDGRRTASLTDQGSAHVAEHRERMGTPWATDDLRDPRSGVALRHEVKALMEAFTQVARVGTPAQLDAATDVLSTARKALYRLLADDED